VLGPKDDKQEFSGNGDRNTRDFALRGGTYRADWAASRRSSSACQHEVIFRGRDTDYSARVVNERVENTDSGERRLNDVPAGRYYFDVNSNCDWLLRLTQP
jgi:hypothetical protein